MPKVKIPRKSTAIDMTAMCDVAFLLLTFFILTAKPRTEDPVPVDTPASTSEVLVPESGIATITIGQGKVFFGVDGPEVRKDLIKQMGAKYNVGFTQTEINKFANLPSVGVPMSLMKQYLDLDKEKAALFKQPGIPIDTTNKDSEFYNWMYQARTVLKNLDNKEMRFTIKGDSKEEYPTLQKVINVMQKQEINKFGLITSLRKE